MRRLGPSLDKINEQIYVGGHLRPDDWTTLQAMGITVDLDLQEESQDVFDLNRPEVYLWLPVVDWAGPSPETIHTGVGFIRQMVDERRSIYIHCFAGVGRSPIMAAGYFVSKGMSADEALAHVKSRRPATDPNKQQIRYLRTFERQWRER